MTDNEHSKYLRDRGTVYDHVIADFIDSTLLKLHSTEQLAGRLSEQVKEQTLRLDQREKQLIEVQHQLITRNAEYAGVLGRLDTVVKLAREMPHDAWRGRILDAAGGVVEKDDAWDREIAADAAAGKLDGLRAEAAAVVEKPEQNSHAGCRYCNGSGWRIVNNSFEDCPRPKSE